MVTRTMQPKETGAYRTTLSEADDMYVELSQGPTVSHSGNEQKRSKDGNLEYHWRRDPG